MSHSAETAPSHHIGIRLPIPRGELSSNAVTLFGVSHGILPDRLGNGKMGTAFATTHPEIIAKISSASLTPYQAELLIPGISIQKTGVVDLEHTPYETIHIQTSEDNGLRAFREAYISQIALQHTYPDLPIVNVIQMQLIRDSMDDVYWPTILMERMSPTPLDVEIKDTTLSIQERKDIVRELLPIAETVDIANTMTPAIIHRDIKAKSILRDKQGKMRLADFGIALLGDHTQLIATGAFGNYPPERLNKQHIPAGDQYCFGVLLGKVLLGNGDARSYLVGDTALRHPDNFYGFISALEQGKIRVDINRLSRRLLHFLYNGDSSKMFHSVVLAEIFSLSLDTEPSQRLYNTRLLNKLVSDIVDDKREALSFAHYAYLQKQPNINTTAINTVLTSLQKNRSETMGYAHELHRFVAGTNPDSEPIVTKTLKLVSSPPRELILR